MSDTKLRLTMGQIAWIVDKVGISNPEQAITRFAELMRAEGISPRKLQEVVERLMAREARSKK
jgi:hypothetical protein